MELTDEQIKYVIDNYINGKFEEIISKADLELLERFKTEILKKLEIVKRLETVIEGRSKCVWTREDKYILDGLREILNGDKHG